MITALLSRVLTKRFIIQAIGAGFAGFLLIQLVPYGWDRDNPPVLAEPAWDSPRTRALTVAACFDCHSNETVWPWYSKIAPLSWLSVRHVNQSRDDLNFSEWPNDELDEIVEEVLGDEMPPWDYMLLHPEARLSDADIQALAEGLRVTIGPLPEKD